MTEVYKADRTI